MNVARGDIIQIVDKTHQWYSCLLIVDEIKSFGAKAYVTLPRTGEAYLRVNSEDFVVVGKAEIVSE